MEPSSTALFVRSASPGAVLRFLERRNDPNRPAEVLLSEAVSTQQWRALFAPDDYLNSVAGPLSIAFPPDVLVATRMKKTLVILAYKEGKHADIHSTESIGGTGPWWAALTFKTPDPIYVWAKERSIPTRYIKAPPEKIIDYATVAILDQRKLLVEDSPRLYRFPLM